MGKKTARLINKLVLAWGRSYLEEIERSFTHAPDMQREVFSRLLKCGRQTLFGKEHDFCNIHSLSDFQSRVKLSKYDDMAPYITRIRQGEKNVLWNQNVRWFAKSSGTSSEKSKYIPITPDSLYGTHFKGMKMMLMNYVHLNPDSRIFSSSALTLGGSVSPDKLAEGQETLLTLLQGKVFDGDLSAVMLRNSPRAVEFIRTPSRKTALVADFAEKVNLICKESTRRNVSNFSGVPSWNLVLMNKILEYTGKGNILEVWPNMELFMHGGISFEPYREIYRKLIPSDNMHYLENYNASEGYFAFQDMLEGGKGMLLAVSNGIFYEFIPFSHLDAALDGDNSHVVPLEGVQTGVDYAIVISTVGGLWRYMPEDLVRFTSINPYRVIVTGRTKMYINAFGEELMINNAEQAISAAASKAGIEITDYTAAPQFMSVDKTVGNIIKGAAEGAGNGSTSEGAGNGNSAEGASNGNTSAGTGNGNTSAGAPADTENGTAGTFAQGKTPAARSALVQGYHVWAIEFSDPLRNPESPDFNPLAVEDFAELLDAEIQKVNSDYEAKRSPGSTMQRLKILPLAPGTFYRWMESRGKTGGQNKVPRLWKDLKYIDQLRNMSGPQ